MRSFELHLGASLLRMLTSLFTTRWKIPPPYPDFTRCGSCYWSRPWHTPWSWQQCQTWQPLWLMFSLTSQSLFTLHHVMNSGPPRADSRTWTLWATRVLGGCFLRSFKGNSHLYLITPSSDLRLPSSDQSSQDPDNCVETVRRFPGWQLCLEPSSFERRQGLLSL